MPVNGREPLVVAWGRIQYEKGFQVLTQAIGHLRHRFPDLRCVIAGRGTYLAELQTQIDMEGVGDIVQLAGFVPDDELRRLLQRTSCVVIPSLYEPFGIVALEGMAAGAPTIVARTGGLAEIVEGTGAGVLFEPGNHVALANCIADVLNHPEVADGMRTKAAALLAGRYTLGRHRGHHARRVQQGQARLSSRPDRSQGGAPRRLNSPECAPSASSTSFRRFRTRLAALSSLANNIHWTWDRRTQALFARLDPELWESSGHDPLRLIAGITDSRWAELSSDPDVIAR